MILKDNTSAANNSNNYTSGIYNEIQLNTDEMHALELPPKFATYRNVRKKYCLSEIEIAFLKSKWRPGQYNNNKKEKNNNTNYETKTTITIAILMTTIIMAIITTTMITITFPSQQQFKHTKAKQPL